MVAGWNWPVVSKAVYTLWISMVVTALRGFAPKRSITGRAACRYALHVVSRTRPLATSSSHRVKYVPNGSSLGGLRAGLRRNAVSCSLRHRLASRSVANVALVSRRWPVSGS
jgi:hypothetical protein